MSCILHIDTVGTTAFVSIAKQGKVVLALHNTTQKDHAAFVQPAITTLLQQTGIVISEVDAVAVTAGPGSYTGIRVGVTSAKGLCYALQKPLLMMNTLELLTVAAQQQNSTVNLLYCPMIDARRMEVFTAVYQQDLTVTLAPCAMILDENSFANYLQNNNIVFFGNGAAKWQSMAKHPNASFISDLRCDEAAAQLSYRLFNNKAFSNLAYATPYYIKEFVSNI
jgi:tRNA threonylcarbamoyladenosine biosynthesis protein TsaB